MRHKTTSKQLSALMAMSQGGRYEVRVVDGQFSLLLFWDATSPDPLAAVRLSSDQAHELAVLLVQAAERTVGGNYDEYVDRLSK